MYQVILASGSPRRRELLNQVGIRHIVMPGGGEETRIQGETPEELVTRLARMKANSVEEDIKGPVVIIGADTVVACGGEILGKPKVPGVAAEMVAKLAGGVHEVYTGVCALIKEESGEVKEICFSEKSLVEVYPMNKGQIEAYAESGEPLDKAGAYAIQGKFALYIKKIEGNFDNIVGLPVSRLYHEVYRAGIDLKTGMITASD